MSMEWPITAKIGSKDEFAQWLSCDRPGLIYRGQARCDWPLQPSLDRGVQKNVRYKDRLAEERRYLECFPHQAFRFLGPIERNLVAQDPQGKMVARMTVMQHFGAPTRLLDWTWSRAAAAYFACIDHCDNDGKIWWISHDAIVKSVDPLWEKHGFRRRKPLKGESIGQVKLESGIFKINAPKLVSMVFLPIPFPRVKAQQGLFTICSRLDMNHDAVLGKQVAKKDRGQVIIDAKLKKLIINFLESRGIDAITLQHAGADRVALRMAWEREISNRNWPSR